MGKLYFHSFKTPIHYCSALENGLNQVKFLLENGADPFIKDITGRDALDIARLLKRKSTISFLEEYFLNPIYSKNEDEKSQENQDSKRLELLKNLFLVKIEEMKKDHEKMMIELRNSYQKEKELLESRLSKEEQNNMDKEKRIQKLEKDRNEIENSIRYQILNGMTFIEDQDLEFNIPLKKRNCFHVKDVQKAKELDGITSLKDLEKIIDNKEFQDIIEIENTLSCLESIFGEWKNGKLKLDELDQQIEFNQDFNDWKTKDHSKLLQLIFEKFDSDEFKNFEISKRINTDFFKMRHSIKGEIIDDIYKKIVETIIIEWKTQNNFEEEMKEFIKLIPIDSSMIQDKKINIEWKMLPKWNQRRKILKDLLRISEKI